MNKNIIKLLVLDVDGTLTDGKIYMSSDGEIMKAFNIKDGCGLHDVLPNINGGIVPAIITGRRSKILENRCSELNIINLFQGVRNKLKKLEELLVEMNLNYANVAYMGDDINDLSCMKTVKEAGCIVACPADAVKQIIVISDFVATHNGGNGAVREFIDWLAEEGMG